MSDFISDLTKAICAHTEAHPDFVRFASERLLSGMCYNLKTSTKIGDLPLALWGLAILESGEWKSKVIKDWMAKGILKYVQAGLPEEEKIMAVQRFSPEGLIESMTWHKEKKYDRATNTNSEYWCQRNKGMMIRDEYTAMIKGTKSKQWMCDTSELLSEIYDGSIQSYYTKKDKFQNVPHCNIAFLAGTTPYIYQYISEEVFVQGLFNRLDFVVLDPKEGDPVKPKADEFFQQPDSHGLDRIWKKFANKLLGLLKSPVDFVWVDYGSNSAKWWLEYKYRIELKKKALSKTAFDRLRGPYLSRQAEKALRLASVYCVSSELATLPRKGSRGDSMTTLIVQDRHMRTAIKRQELYYNHFEELLKRWLKAPKEEDTVPSDIRNRMTMMQVLLDTPLKMITNTQWHDRVGWNRNKFYNVQADLKDIEWISIMPPEKRDALTMEQLGTLDMKLKGRKKAVYTLGRRYPDSV